jgi:molybdopterin/thiamine biosynthesis adenylyltransferase/rhodanese-related sulfurtransferase
MVTLRSVGLVGCLLFLSSQFSDWNGNGRQMGMGVVDAFVTQKQYQSPSFHKFQRSASSPSTPSTTSSSSTARFQSKLTNDEIQRYSRHLVLSDVGMKGQLALKDASVLVVGAGGLGSPCLLYLAAAGVGHIGIVDADTVDASNLQRQIIHGTSTIGSSKCQSAAARITDINPGVQVRLYEQELTAATAMSIVGDGFSQDIPKWDVVIDGSDNFPTKYLINDVCQIFGRTWIYSAILAFEGQLSVFNLDGVGPDYRDLLPTPPPPGDVPSCAEGGVLGVLPGTMGCLQATEAIKIIMGRREGVLSGRVLVFDALAMKFSEIGLKRSPDREPITELIDYQGFCGGPQAAPSPAAATTDVDAAAATKPGPGARTMDEVEGGDESVNSDDATAPGFHSIQAKKCLEKLKDGWSPWVLDVRLQTENDIVALPFTDHVVPHRLVRVKDVPKAGDVLVYCKAGIRGKKACNALIAQGVAADRLYNLEGGIMSWQTDVDPSMPRY